MRLIHHTLACFVLLAAPAAGAEPAEPTSALTEPAPNDPTPAEQGPVAHGAFQDGEPRVTTTLVAERGAEAMHVGVVFDIAPGWHIYWKNPGQTGLSTEVTFDVESGTVGPLHWPAPAVFDTNDGFIISYGYEDEVLLWSDVQAPAGDDDAPQWVSAVADYLACRSICIPGRHEMRLRVEADAGTVSPFVGAAAQLPRTPADVGWVVEGVLDRASIAPGDEFELRIDVRAPEGEAPSASASAEQVFVPERVAQLSFEPQAFEPTSTGEGFTLRVAGRAGLDAVAGDQTLRAVLLVPVEGGTRALDVAFPIPRTAANPTPEEDR